MCVLKIQNQESFHNLHYLFHKPLSHNIDVEIRCRGQFVSENESKEYQAVIFWPNKCDLVFDNFTDMNLIIVATICKFPQVSDRFLYLDITLLIQSNVIAFVSDEWCYFMAYFQFQVDERKQDGEANEGTLKITSQINQNICDGKQQTSPKPLLSFHQITSVKDHQNRCKHPYLLSILFQIESELGESGAPTKLYRSIQSKHVSFIFLTFNFQDARKLSRILICARSCE